MPTSARAQIEPLRICRPVANRPRPAA